MYKILILLALVSVVKPEESIEWFYGEWVPVAEYPQAIVIPICEKLKIDIQAGNNGKCTCDDKKVSSVNHVMNSGNYTELMPVIIVSDATKVAQALDMKCKCDDHDIKPAVYKKIAENYFVLYDKSSGEFTEAESNRALLFLKKIPKLSKLRQVVASIDDFNQKNVGYLCEPNYFVSEFDDLD